MAMEDHMKKVYSGDLKDRIRIPACPHCQSVLTPKKDGDYFESTCFKCDVDWEIKLLKKCCVCKERNISKYPEVAKLDICDECCGKIVSGLLSSKKTD